MKEERKEDDGECLEEDEEDKDDKDSKFPLGSKRPWDEFYDMKSIKPIRIESVVEDGSIQILTEVEGVGNFVDEADTVYYKHETRFDNG